MKQILPKLVIVVAVGLASCIFFLNPNNGASTSGIPGPIVDFSMQPPPPVNMPVVKEANPQLANIRGGTPSPNRSSDCLRWLQSSFQIRVPGGAGSGTLCYYDQKTNTAYVISCGHLWNGMLGMKSNQTASIVTWYHNNIKLARPKSYNARIIFIDTAADVSLMTFQPDWVPDVYYPIAKVKRLNQGERAHSLGCDHAEEVADYFVEIIGYQGDPRGNRSLVTRFNSPRPGRSGGGLVDQEGYYIGICWGTSEPNGTGIGYFVPLDTVHRVYEQHGYGFLLRQSVPGLARNIPIYDHNNPNQKYSKNYILMPIR